jgi:hypothetical protein
LAAGLKMKTVCFSKTLVSTNQSTGQLNPKEHQNCHHDNRKSHIANFNGEKTSHTIGPISSALKMETACFSETLAPTNRSTKQFNPKEHHQNRHRYVTHHMCCFTCTDFVMYV